MPGHKPQRSGLSGLVWLCLLVDQQKRGKPAPRWFWALFLTLALGLCMLAFTR